MNNLSFSQSMWTISELFFLFVGSLLIINYLRVLWNSRSLPPGPFPLPFVGNLWRLKFQLHPATLTQLSKLYGKIYTVWLGDSPLVVLNGWRAVKDGIVSHSEELSGRPVASYLKDLLGGGGILMSNGHVWKQQRRFGLMTLRNLGLGKRGLESRIQDEAQYIVESFRAYKGAPFDPFNIITATVANVIAAVVFGHRFSIDDATYQELIKSNHGLLEGGASPWAKMYDILPWLMKHVPGPHQTAFTKIKFLRQFTKKEIRTHKENGLLEEPQDVIDYYLDQIEKRKTEVDSTFDEKNLISMVIDLFLAGTETTTTTLQWALLYMVAYPHIQQNIHEELDAVLDGSKVVCYEDRKRLPYTNAVIHEVQRFANIAAVGIPRTCVKEVKVYAFSLKKDTMVLANLDSVLFDPQCWKTPDQFNPNNFLDEKGDFLINEAFLPFSGGARVCLGEQLARYELFIFFTTLMRSYQFHLPEGVTEANTKYIYNLTLQPHPYQVCAIPR
ncbi:PREDICTED: cytochrome P450 2J6-like [Nanorana parkeri]|uniref:cytochrome P450 2J6-like n=1 Tax=Nanorana parkeri TaxID=125878 RepID=UPI0008547C77|nr:PREDICTED: cytochrome P450 2J6-like [Nanorana parkeri]